MSALLILVLSGLACTLFTLRLRPRPVRARSNAKTAMPSVRSQAASPESMPRLVRQLAALLAAGRTEGALWQAMAHVLAMELERGPGLAAARSAPLKSRPPEGTGQGVRTGSTVVRPAVQNTDATLALVLTLQRASTMGLSTAVLIQAACRASPARRASLATKQGTLTRDQRRMWLDIAACFTVCEASGAPVAAVLERLATTLEADHDAAAQRETALAGPKATVLLLTWLPLVGLGLGMLMGVDPLGALFGSPSGWAVLGSGLGFAAAGRFWSAKMIRDAIGPATSKSRPGS